MRPRGRQDGGQAPRTHHDALAELPLALETWSPDIDQRTPALKSGARRADAQPRDMVPSHTAPPSPPWTAPGKPLCTGNPLEAAPLPGRSARGGAPSLGCSATALPSSPGVPLGKAAAMPRLPGGALNTLWRHPPAAAPLAPRRGRQGGAHLLPRPPRSSLPQTQGTPRRSTSWDSPSWPSIC